MSADDEYKIRAVVPGQGWMVRRWCDGDPHDYFDTPVLVWQYTDANGWRAHDVDGSGFVQESEAPHSTFWHPAATTRPPEDGTAIIAAAELAAVAQREAGLLDRVRLHVQGHHTRCQGSGCRQASPFERWPARVVRKHAEGDHSSCDWDCDILRANAELFGARFEVDQSGDAQ